MALRRLRELRRRDSQRLLAWSLLTILKAEYLLRATSLMNLLKRFGERPDRSVLPPEDPPSPNGDSLDRLWRYSNFIARILLRSRRPCLLRSLTLYRHCREHGAPASIHFGIKHGDGGLQGHSWVSLQGTPLFETPESLQSYAVIYSYPEDQRPFDLDRSLRTVKELP